MGLKSRDPQKGHLESLLNAHTKLKLPSSIWREIGKEHHFFMIKKGEILTSSIPIYLGVDFLKYNTNFDCLSTGSRKIKFCVLDPSAPPPLNSGTTEF